ncbi:MAG: HlyD family efflux transporter periplasmic adaptor subunit [Bacteroidetes bacterium]|nr:HlyD family efflux transporter periplasmic adaptor subunit [Bacteroidota bacterium]
MKLSTTIAFVCYTLAIFFASCKNQAVEADETERPKTAVTITTPTLQGFADFIQLNGNTIFQKKAVIRANITGYLTSMKWKPGDHIASGTIFCSIQTKEQNALSNIDSKEPSLKQFKVPINVSSSVSGIITAVNYNKGDFVNEGDIIANVTDPSSLVISINVPYEYHAQVYKGKGCSVQFPDGKVINAQIQEVVPYIDSASQTQTYLIRFPGNSLLPENMNLIVRIPMMQASQAISLPLEAIQTDETQENFWVMKLVNDSIAIKVPVKTGLQHDSLIQILSGVNMTDKIIVTGGYGLSDSSIVTTGDKKTSAE